MELGLGTTEAALLVGGSPVGNTEEWNGTNWSEVTNAYVAPSFHSIGGGGGTVNDAHVYGKSRDNRGSLSSVKFLLYDGTAWSQDAAQSLVRRYASGRGSTGNVRTWWFK